MASISKTNSVIPSSFSSFLWNAFLSFRGIDTRNNFTGHLYAALDRVGIRTFIDDRELPRGEEISLTLLKAIEESNISIVIFSENYASSPWCLEELVKIFECRKTIAQLVLPVFYNIDPKDVRHQIGSFELAVQLHKQRFGADMVKVNKWQATLVEAANLSGYHLAKNGHEANLIQEIVDRVLFEVNNMRLSIAKHPVGIESRVQDIISLLKVHTDGVKIVGIHGRSGIGKTTIAKAVFNKIFRSFDAICFLANVREVSRQQNGLVCLQEQLLSELLRTKKFRVGNISNGVSLIKERLRHKKVLIVLDDLDQLNQLEVVGGKWNMFAPGSRIIITTRHANLLKKIQVHVCHELKKLDDNESLELFSLHAFNKPVPSEDYMELSKDLVRDIDGIPLFLVVLGSKLVNRNLIEWRRFIKKLDREMLKKLKARVDDIFDNVAEILDKEISDVVDTLDEEISAVADTLDEGLSDVADTLLDVAEILDKEISDVFDTLDEEISDVADTLDEGLSDVADTLLNVAEILDKEISDVVEEISDVADTLDVGLSDVADTLLNVRFFFY